MEKFNKYLSEIKNNNFRGLKMAAALGLGYKITNGVANKTKLNSTNIKYRAEYAKISMTDIVSSVYDHIKYKKNNCLNMADGSINKYKCNLVRVDFAINEFKQKIHLCKKLETEDINKCKLKIKEELLKLNERKMKYIKLINDIKIENIEYNKSLMYGDKNRYDNEYMSKDEYENS